MKTLKLGVLGLVLASSAWAQDIVTQDATGEAAIVNNDEPKAFDEATKAALRNAVEQVAGVTVTGSTQTLNNVLVRDQVVAHTSGYVKKFETVSKKKEKGVATVTVKAQIGKSEISRDVEAARELVKRFGSPSLVIMLQEQTMMMDPGGKASGVSNSDVAAAELTKRFKADGWDIKDPAFAAGKVRIAPGATVGSGEAKEIGDLTKAAYILYGTVSLRNQAPTEAMKSPGGGQIYFPVTGEYDLALFATDSGTQIVKFANKLEFTQKDKGQPSQSVGYERTAYGLISYKAEEISAPVRQGALEYFRSREVNGAEYLVSATGLANYAAAKDFKDSLGKLHGVKSIEQQNFKGGVANYKVTFAGSSGEFAEALGKVEYKKKKLDVTEVSGNKLVLAVAK